MKRTVNILCVEDIPADVTMLDHALRKGGLDFRMKRVETRESFLRELVHNPPDLILSDHGLPCFDGFTALSLARNRCPEVPFIFVTAALGEERTIETFERGATDYILKKDLSKLVSSIERALAHAQERKALKQSEQELRESEDRYRRLIEFCPDAFLVECGEKLAFANRTAARLLGFDDAEQLVEKPLQSIVHPESWPMLADRLARLRENSATYFWKKIAQEGAEGQSVVFPFVEARFLNKNGLPIEVELAVTPMTLQKRQATQIIVRNITERKETLEKLRRSQAVKTLILETALDAIVFIDPQGRVQEWNPAAQKVFGYTRAEAVGQPLDELIIPPGLRDVYTGGLTAYLMSGVSSLIGRPVELTLRRKDGSEFRAEMGISRITTEESSYCTAIIRDITERKQSETSLRESEERLRQLNEELEQRVSKRTSQLEAANKDLESFSYSISHDLRAPLRHIASYVDILQSEAGPKLDETSRHYLQTVADSAANLGALIDALLAFSRMGHSDLSLRTVNLAKLVEESRRELRREQEGRNITWEVGYLPEVRGDAMLLRQVIINLISNALKYTRPREQAKIEIGAGESENEVVFFIRDNGVGFEMQYVDKLFGVFQRLHPAAEFEGIGIGLANVRRIIQRHGGRVWADGKPDGGATFFFSIPKIGKG